MVGSVLDLTFIVNEPGKTLKDRFKQLIKDCKYFDCIVAYFRISGFYALWEALEKTEKIRILVGMGVDKKTYDLLSVKEVKQEVQRFIEEDMSQSEDHLRVEEGVRKFIEWIREGKLEIRAHPSRRLHAKVYIMTFKEGDRDVGRVITGSSNFTESGLEDNLEFNVELKDRADYEYAKSRFEELWKESVDVTEDFVQTLKERTWLKEDITPYELYLKFLYEYFKEDLEGLERIYQEYEPTNFKRLEYQEQAVLNAKKIIEEHGGVFISDVVGLGKTYITAMLVKQLGGRTIVIAPPNLIDKNNPGSWYNVFSDFGIPAYYESTGKLDEALEEIKRREYKNVVIDESHRFRNESTISYEKLMQICRGKRVILVSATPYNNTPLDILNQIKLFQNPKNSTIPGIKDLERFFKRLQKRLDEVDRQENYDEYLRVAKEVAKEIRDKVLKYIMVRRTRSEIEKYFAEDLKRNNIKFPEVEDPKPIFYKLNDEEDKVFMETVELITKKLKYARYTPMLYLKRDISQQEAQSQRNMGSFMKVLLVKRLESSFYAFKKSIERFINSYEKFIKHYDNGVVYVSKKYINKIFELLESGDDEAIHRLIDEGKAERYNSEDFIPEFRKDLEWDLNILKRIKSMWDSLKRDPKLEELLKNLKENQLLKKGKIIIFTESKETAEYLAEKIEEDKHIEGKVLLFTGQSSPSVMEDVINNFSAKAREKRDEYRILISTDVLSEGVSLHRSNIVINYDIPWNPTRLMQRVGRVNRIDTPHDKIYTFNFFPTKQADTEIELTNIARSKVETFLTLLGGDSAILTEGEPVSSHELFDKLLSKKTITEEEEEEESELKYLRIIEDIKNNNEALFQKIKNLPKKARSAKALSPSIEALASHSSLLTFFRRGKLMKFFLADGKEVKEVDFLTAAKIFESQQNEKSEEIPLQKYYELLERNIKAFEDAINEESLEVKSGITGSNRRLLNLLKANQDKITDGLHREYINLVINRLEEGLLPKRTIQRVLKSIDENKEDILEDPIKLIGILKSQIPEELLKGHYIEAERMEKERGEVILSLYLL
ncbi:MAG: helicase [Aquificota bacterium]|nr:MAG: helicase [Aquificota bacterium]